MPTSLGIGFVGAGFMNRFHVQSLVGVRDCHVAGVFSPTRANAELLAAMGRNFGWVSRRSSAPSPRWSRIPRSMRCG